MNRIIFLLTGLIASSPAWAHEGPRIWIGNVAGRVATFTSDNDLDPTVYSPSRLFTTEFVEVFGVYTTTFPGFEVKRAGGNVASETTFGFEIAGPALYFDPASNSYVSTQSEFGPPQPGPVPQLAVSRGSQICVTSGGPVAGFDFFTFHQVGDHAHLAYTLFGNGTSASDGPAGVYALPLRLNADGLQTSPIFYLLIGKDVSDDDALFQSAIRSARKTLLSELQSAAGTPRTPTAIRRP